MARRAFRRATTYRAAAVSGVFVNTVFGYLRASVLVFVAAAGGGAVGGLSGADLATFAFVSQGLLMVVGAFGDPEIADRVRTGDIVIDFYRPADLQTWWLAVWLGNAAFQVVARGVPPVLLGALAFDVRWPPGWAVGLAFAVSVLLASIAGFAIRFCSNIAAFWLLDNRGIEQLVTLALSFFGGLLLPLSLFPPPLEWIARALPFAAMVQTPAEVYLGTRPGREIVPLLAMQALWVVVLLVAGRVLLAAATRKLGVQGG